MHFNWHKLQYVCVCVCVCVHVHTCAHDKLPTNQLHDINWGARHASLDHASRAPQLMSHITSMYMRVCVCVHACVHVHVGICTCVVPVQICVCAQPISVVAVFRMASIGGGPYG